MAMMLMQGLNTISNRIKDCTRRRVFQLRKFIKRQIMIFRK